MENANDAVAMRKKIAVKSFRHDSKHIREMLREKCREQIREKRQELFNVRRLGLQVEEESFNDSILAMLRKELSDLTMMVGNQNNGSSQELNGGRLIENDMTDIEDETWSEHQSMLKIHEEMQQNDDFMNEFIGEMLKDEVVCPICQMASIEESPEGLVCQGCKINLPLKISIRQLGVCIEEQLNAHNRNCLQQASFAILPDNDISFVSLGNP